jgi:hypothetical protein
MPPDVLQRLTWAGTPVDPGNLFVVHKDRRAARTTAFSHVFGWELRLLVGEAAETVRSQVCRTQHEVLNITDEWKQALVAEGWK